MWCEFILTVLFVVEKWLDSKVVPHLLLKVGDFDYIEERKRVMYDEVDIWR